MVTSRRRWVWASRLLVVLGLLVCVSASGAETMSTSANSAMATNAAPASAATMNTSTTSATDAARERLDRILAGGTPSSVADLKAMQAQIVKLTEKLSQTTVGVQVGAAQGSGVIISKDGYVLTAAHVAGTPNRDVIFLMSDGRMLRGKTLGLNRTMDAGLMKITEGDDFPFVEMGVSDGLKEGQWCLATGHPGGYQSDRTPVLRLGRILLTDRTAITTDCTLVGGDSGGPLFDMQGRVIGINSRISGPLTANMHVPVSTFKDTWARLEKGDAWGHFPGQEPYIGIRGEADVDVAKIAHIFEDSPAESAGLKVGDVVLALDEQAVTDFASLSALVREKQPGDSVRLKVQRGDETKEIRLTIGKRGG